MWLFPGRRLNADQGLSSSQAATCADFLDYKWEVLLKAGDGDNGNTELHALTMQVLKVRDDAWEKAGWNGDDHLDSKQLDEVRLRFEISVDPLVADIVTLLPQKCAAATDPNLKLVERKKPGSKDVEAGCSTDS